MDDREATQRFTIFNILTSHCGEFLTGDRVEQIRDEIFEEMTTGGCSWAFKPDRLTRAQPDAAPLPTDDEQERDAAQVSSDC